MPKYVLQISYGLLYFGQEAAALAATQVAFVLQSGQSRGLQFAIAPGPTVQQEQV